MMPKVLLVIDMLNDFLNPKGALYCGDEARRITPVIRTLMDLFRASHHAILFACDAHAKWVTGVVASICVMDTVGDLRNRDCTPVVPVTAVADFDSEDHAFALKRMERVYGARLVETPLL